MLDEITNSLNLIVSQTQENMPYLLNIILVLWGVFFVTRVLPGILYLGITPRKIHGIPGIFIAPFLHANFNHLFFNTIPLLVLSNFILINGITHYLQVSFMIIIISGVLIWLFARPAIHIGASAVITGYWAFLVINSYEEPNVTSIILAIICLYYFTGIFLGVFPQGKGVSWEGHLFGLLAGITTSYYFSYLVAFF